MRLEDGEYIDVTKYDIEKRMRMFPKLPRYKLLLRYCIVYKYFFVDVYDVFAGNEDRRMLWDGSLVDAGYKETKSFVNKLGRM